MSKNPDIQEFEKFYKTLMKAAPQGYKPFLFRVAPGDKNPELRFGSWKKARISYKEAIAWMKSGGNVGIAATNDDPLVIIDIDNPEIRNQIKKRTLCVRSRKRTGFHYFYVTNEKDKIRNVPTEKDGEIRAHWQYVVAAGSYCKTDLSEVPVELRDSRVGYYTVEDAIPPGVISYEELPQVFKDRIEKVKEDESKVDRKEIERVTREFNRDKENISALFDLTVYDILDRIPRTEERFPSLFHDSKTGKNTSVLQGLIHCWRHNVAHNALTALAVLAGELDCVDAGFPHKGSGAGASAFVGNKKALFAAWKYAKERKLIPDDDPIPLTALADYAVRKGLITKDKVEDGWKLPVDVYNKALRELIKEGIDPGRKERVEFKSEKESEEYDAEIELKYNDVNFGILKIKQLEKNKLQLTIIQEENTILPATIYDGDFIKKKKLRDEVFHHIKAAISEDSFNEFISVLQKEQNKRLQQKTGEEEEEEEKEEIKLGYDESLLYKIKKELDDRHVGDDEEKLLAFVLSVSGLLPPEDKQIVVIKGTPSVGKTNLCKHVTSWCKIREVGQFSENVLKYEDLTAYDIFYLNELFGEERTRIRLMSASDSGYIALVSEKSEKGWHAQEYRIPPMTIFTTTAAIEVETQFEDRSWIISLDESKEQTKRVINFFVGKHTKEMHQKLMKTKKEKTIIDTLRPRLSKYDILIPYAMYIPEIITKLTKLTIRTRRDIQKITALIKLITFLYQNSRPKIGDILIATPIDLYYAYRIGWKQFITTITILEKRIINTLEHINAGLIKKASDLAKLQGISRRYAYNILGEAKDREYIYYDEEEELYKLSEEGRNILEIFENINVPEINLEKLSACVRASYQDLEEKTESIILSSLEYTKGIDPITGSEVSLCSESELSKITKKDREVEERILQMVSEVCKQDKRGALVPVLMKRIAEKGYSKEEVQEVIDRLIDEGSLLVNHDDTGAYIIRS
jgi:hypothetical protein